MAPRSAASRVPTREEITANIRSNKRTVDESEQLSVTRAFQSSLASFLDHQGVTHPLAGADDDTIQSWMAKWNDAMKQVVDERSISQWVAERDLRAAKALHEAFGTRTALTDQDWTGVDKIINYSVVGSAVPSRMMHKIEDMASRLANDLVSGKASLSSEVDLNDIGNQVLSQCSSDDMRHFAGNIDSILPTIGKFAADSGVTR